MVTRDEKKLADDIIRMDLAALSSDQLQKQLQAYYTDRDDTHSRQLVQTLVHELQAQQTALETRNAELQESQRLLEESRDRYADLYDFAPVSYITFDSAGCINEINLTGANLLGQERDSLLGKPFQHWLDYQDGKSFIAHLESASQTEEVITTELQLKIPDGSHVDVRLQTTANNQTINNKPSYRTVISNISYHKQAEQEIRHQGRQLRLLSDAIPTFIAYVNQEGRFEFVNKIYEEWFQRPREQILGITVRELVGEKTYAEVAGYMQTALAGHALTFEVTYPITGEDDRQFSVSYIPDFSDQGEVLGYFSLARDVTKIRRLEALDRMRMLEMARVARINTMGEMVAELAHELNQPLAAITIYSDAVSRLLGRDELDIPGIQNALNEIRLQASRAGDVITRLRDFVSKREIQSETVQINNLVEEVMKLIAVEARWHGVQVKLELGEGIPPISVDRILIEQVILNLARNAIEAMDAIEKKQRVLVIRTMLGKYDEIELSVDDNGPGIQAAEAEKIFEPFYTSKEHGMGMGLGISRTIIKAHHGRLWAIPNEHGGSLFTFTLPFRVEDKDI